MLNLTPGDFATVKRRCILLGEDLSPVASLGQLEREVAAKHRLKADDEPQQRVD